MQNDFSKKLEEKATHYERNFRRPENEELQDDAVTLRLTDVDSARRSSDPAGLLQFVCYM